MVVLLHHKILIVDTRVIVVICISQDLKIKSQLHEDAFYLHWIPEISFYEHGLHSRRRNVITLMTKSYVSI